MKRKTLIVGASAPFEGPWVNLEQGIWLVEPSRSGVAHLRIENGKACEDVMLVVNGVEVIGPCRVMGVVTLGEEVYLTAGRVRDA